MSRMDDPFHGKVALVTGAGSGIGRASAVAFGRAGAKVVVADISQEGGKETVRKVKEQNTDAIFIQVDIASASSVERMVKQAADTFGQVDFAHNNAGVEGDRGRIADYSEESWDRVINTNLKGVWLSMRYEIPQMLRQRGGIIVNTSSVTGLTGSRGVSAYVASKHGIIGLTKAAAMEYARDNIRVNAVCPGTIRTPMIERFTSGDAGVLAQFADAEVAGRLGTPEEVAEAVIWLCSDSSSFVNGHALVVDGGRLA